MESFLKLIKLSLFLVEILDKPSPPFLHLVQSPLKPLNNTCHWSLDLSSVLGVPDIMSDELLNGFLPLLLEEVLVAHHLQLVHEAVNILYEDVVAGDQHLLLLTTGAASGQGFVSWGLV